jgi:hypothetical protein
LTYKNMSQIITGKVQLGTYPDKPVLLNQPATSTVHFAQPLAYEYEVLPSLVFLDADHNFNLRYNLEVKNQTPAGFDLVLSSWADTHIFSAQAQYLVLPKNVLAVPNYTEASQGKTIIPTQALNQFTVTAIITLHSPWNGRIFDKISAGGADGWLLDIYPENTVRVISNGSVVSSSVKLNNTPHLYLAATYGKPEGTAIYQNGVRTDLFNSVHLPPQNTFPIRIGFDSNNQNVFPGIIQRARIYYSALNDDQVLADYLEAKHTFGL